MKTLAAFLLIALLVLIGVSTLPAQALPARQNPVPSMKNSRTSSANGFRKVI
jgi:hypothetical protein